MTNGIVNVYKEKGFTSFDVVAKMRGIFHQKKIGHTGTLDPDAEGVLPVCLGKATKVCDLLTDKDKEYKAVLLLGKQTDTQDITGTILNETEVNVTEEKVRQVIDSFVGTYDQVPPMYSALKVNGQKLCNLARAGITVERKSRPVTIHSITITKVELPEVEMVVHCSKGTYIRTLCEDIGLNLGTFGCMKSLLRTRVAHFTLENSYTLEQISRLVAANEIAPLIMQVDALFEQYSAVTCLESAEKLIRNGNRIPMEYVCDYTQGAIVRLYDFAHQFIGLYSYIEEDREFKPYKLFME